MSREATWMIFVREHDNTHYLFNGKWPIAISPDAEAFGKFSDSDSTDQQITNTEPHIALMKEIMSGRKKLFVINKLRYNVLQRGTFVEN